MLVPVTFLLTSTFLSVFAAPQKREASVIQLPPRQDYSSRGLSATQYIRHPERLRSRFPLDQLSAGAATHEARKSSATRAQSLPVSPTDDEYDIQRRADPTFGAINIGNDQIAGLYSVNWGNITIGTPKPGQNAQQISVVFDTGSSDLWVPSTECTDESEGTPCHGPLFDPSASTTFTPSDKDFSIGYLDESTATGKLGTDKVTIAGLTIDRQVFGVITKSKSVVPEGAPAGILGLGMVGGANSKAYPLVGALYRQNKLASPLFAFYMARYPSFGELSIGAVNSAHYDANKPNAIVYHPVNHVRGEGLPSEWNIISGGISYNNGPLSGDLDANIDSGSNFITLPEAHAASFYASVPGAQKVNTIENLQGAYMFPCGATLGPISFSFKFANGTQVMYEMNGADFNLGPMSNLDPIFPGASKAPGGMCLGAVEGQDIGLNKANIGDPFMKSWYMVFNYYRMAIGFAKPLA